MSAPTAPGGSGGRWVLRGGALPGPAACAVAALGCAGLAAVLGILVVTGWPPLAQVDQALGEWVRQAASDAGWPVTVAWGWNWAGLAWVTVPLLAGAIVLLLRAHRPRAAAFLALSGILGLLISRTTKAWVDRARPPWPEAGLTVDPHSFPSGHAMVGIYGWCAVGLLALRYWPGRAGQVVGWGLIMVGVLMGPSRLAIGAHWPSDVVAGWLLGAAALLAAAAIVRALPRRG